MKTIVDYQIIDHGVQHSQYFQGCGVSFTPFDEVATGIGESAYEALEDALDSLGQNDWNVNTIKNNMSKHLTVPADLDDCYHYVSIRVKVAKIEMHNEEMGLGID